MKSRFAGVALALAILALGMPGPLYAQGVTGQLAGTVIDATGAVLPGVTIVVKNVNTLATRETLTGPTGTFLIPDLLAGTFDLSASLAGFKTYEEKGIVVASTERVQLRTIALEVGGVTETVVVQSEAVRPDDERRAPGAGHPPELRRHRPQGPRLRRPAEGAAGRDRHARA